MEILVIGLNHITAPVEIRERVSFPEDLVTKCVRKLTHTQGIEEAIIFSTCNRSEVLVSTLDSEGNSGVIVNAIGEVHSIDPASFQEYLYVKKGAEGVRHVFRVASSLDSMVLGEPQVLGQVKEGYRLAVRANSAGPVLNRLMHRAFFTAKRVRTETGIGTAAVSVAYVAVELARKILGHLGNKNILLIGAGEMAELAARHLATLVDRPILVANRTYETACTLARNLSGDAVPIERLEEILIAADIVITSTASCEPLIKKEWFKTVMRRRRFRPIFVIDIAIPRDVEPEVNDIDGVYLYNIDDLQAVADENLGERKQEALRAERIVAEEVVKFMHWIMSLQAAPTIVALRDKLEEIRKGEVQRLNGKLSALGPEEREAVELITRSIINKIAHDPITFLKKAGASQKRNLYLATAQRLFNLDGAPSKSHGRDEDPPEE
jgi:glutamyl-tRNA reductase